MRAEASDARSGPEGVFVESESGAANRRGKTAGKNSDNRCGSMLFVFVNQKAQVNHGFTRMDTNKKGNFAFLGFTRWVKY